MVRLVVEKIPLPAGVRCTVHLPQIDVLFAPEGFGFWAEGGVGVWPGVGKSYNWRGLGLALELGLLLWLGLELGLELELDLGLGRVRAGADTGAWKVCWSWVCEGLGRVGVGTS